MRTEATIPAWLIMRPDWSTYRAGPLWTFSALALRADDEGKVTIPVTELAEAMHTWPRTVIRHLDHLRAIGAVTSSRAGGSWSGVNTYTLHFDGPASSGSVGHRRAPLV